MPFLFEKAVSILTLTLMVGVGKGRMLTYLLAHFFLVVQLLMNMSALHLGSSFQETRRAWSQGQAKIQVE